MRPGSGRRRILLTSLALGAAGALAASTLSGCTLSTDVDHSDADAPAVGPLAQPVRTAWVFSSGGPRGFVHVGVLKGLAELRLQPDLVVGASAGAVVGALFAGGLAAREIETQALELRPMSLARWAPAASERFSGAALRQLVG